MTLQTTIPADADFLARLGDPQRMRALAAYDLFDPQLHADLDELQRATAERLGAPVGLLSFVLDTTMLIGGQYGIPDDNWAVLAGGLPVEWSFCGKAVLRHAPYVVPNALEDPAESSNPLVAMGFVRSYAGIPLVDSNGEVLGAQCVLNFEPHEMSAEELGILAEAADEAMLILNRYRVQQSA